jgi:DNA-binding transcriptional LysR family regulator
MHSETLKIFCDLVELRSFSKAAEKHIVSQSAVSQQIAQLELAFKCQLVDRKKRPLKLTSEGEMFYEAARDVLDRIEKLKSDLNSLQKSASNRINVAAIFSIGMHSLQPYVKQFMSKYPSVNVHIEYLSAAQIYELVGRGVVDVGLVAVPQKIRAIEAYRFCDEPLVFVCSPEHPLAQQRRVNINQLKMQPFIAFEEGIPTREFIDGILQQYDVTVKRVMTFDNTETIKRAVEINAGVTILPQTVVQQEVAGGTLKAMPFSNGRFVRPTAIIVRKEKVLSRPVQYFIELLRKK